MPSLSRVISSYVRYHLERGKSYAQVFQLSVKRFPTVQQSSILEYVAYWASAARYAQRFAGFSDRANVSRLAPPTQTGSRGTIRLSVAVDITVPTAHGTKRLRGKKYEIDLPATGTVGELRENVIRRIRDDLNRYYEMANFGGGRQQLRISYLFVQSV